MTDLSKTIAPKSDQFNADDLITGPLTIRVAKVSQWNAEQPIAVHFEGDNGKPYLPCKSMRRVMVQVWGSDGASYVGRAMRLYRDPEVMYGGVKVGGIRISHMSHLENDIVIALTATKKTRAPYKVRVLPADEMPGGTGQDDAGPDLAEYTTIARVQARKGKDAFKEWWNSQQGKEGRAAGLTMTDDLRRILDDAERAAVLSDPLTDVFGLRPLNPTPEELAAAEAAAAEALAEQAAALEEQTGEDE